MEPMMSMVQSSRESFLDVCIWAIYMILQKANDAMKVVYCNPDNLNVYPELL